MNDALNNKFDAAKREVAKTRGLLTLREWLAKWLPGRHLAELVNDFVLDGGRGFVRDEPPRTLTNADGTFFVLCGGPVVIACPPPVAVSERLPACGGGWYDWQMSGAFYFVLDTDVDPRRPRLRFAEAA
jgi:hypothetical protein